MPGGAFSGMIDGNEERGMGLMKKYLILLCLAVAFALLAAGCGKDSAQSQQKAELTVVTSFYPLYIATINVAQGVEGVEVVNLTKPQTGCLHDYQLTTEDMRKLEKADVFVVNGVGMEQFLHKAVEQRKGLRVVEASAGIALLGEKGEENPHVWVSVRNAAQQVDTIAEQLAALDPKHADAYRKNAAVYAEKLQALRAQMHAQIDPLPHKTVVTFHEAFPYFAQEFGLKIAAVVEREPGSEPSPRALEETIEMVRSAGVRALFAEPQYPPGAADTIARETGATVYTLDPVVTGEATPSAKDAYIEAMRKNAQTLTQALR